MLSLGQGSVTLQIYGRARFKSRALLLIFSRKIKRGEVRLERSSPESAFLVHPRTDGAPGKRFLAKWFLVPLDSPHSPLGFVQRSHPPDGLIQVPCLVFLLALRISGAD